MAIIHQWLSKKLLHTHYVGLVTGREMIDAAIEISADPRFDDIRFVIGDWSAITNAQISVDEVKELAAFVGAVAVSFPRIINASVVANYESGQARAALYNDLAQNSPWQTKTFSSLDSAMEWLSSKGYSADN